VVESSFSATGISKSFGALKVLENVSITIKSGEMVGLLGPNGAGKTTFINIVAGYEHQDSGSVSLDGNSLDGMAPHDRARIGLARTFQSGRLFSNLPVSENIALGALGLGTTAKIANERTNSILEILNLEPLSNLNAGSISHGNARLVGLARAVAANPKYLIMDEPAAGLNEHEVPHLLDALAKINKDLGCGMFLVEHNVGLVAKACSRVVVLNTGNLIFDGTPFDALNNDAVKSAYLGDTSLEETTESSEK